MTASHEPFFSQVLPSSSFVLESDHCELVDSSRLKPVRTWMDDLHETVWYVRHPQRLSVRTP